LFLEPPLPSEGMEYPGRNGSREVRNSVGGFQVGAELK
jgi:hypothetical protein